MLKEPVLIAVVPQVRIVISPGEWQSMHGVVERGQDKHVVLERDWSMGLLISKRQSHGRSHVKDLEASSCRIDRRGQPDH